MANTPEQDISELKIRSFETEASVLFLSVRLRAFQDFVHQVWEVQRPSDPTGTRFRSALRELERDRVDALLADYADKNPTMASILKKLADAEFPTSE